MFSDSIVEACVLEDGVVTVTSLSVQLYTIDPCTSDCGDIPVAPTPTPTPTPTTSPTPTPTPTPGGPTPTPTPSSTPTPAPVGYNYFTLTACPGGEEHCIVV